MPTEPRPTKQEFRGQLYEPANWDMKFVLHTHAHIYSNACTCTSTYRRMQAHI